MRRAFGLSLGLVVGIVVGACSGSAGPAGPAGAAGATGAKGATGTAGSGGGSSGAASVSAVSPPNAFIGRTVDLSIVGSNTTWDSTTKVTFAASGVKVNSITAASVTGLQVNVTVSTTATLGATDVTVTAGSTTTVYKNAFEVLAPLAITATPSAGVPQGGLANIHVAMLDLTTPFDADTINVTLSSPDLAMSQPQPSDYAFDMTIEADVLSTPGTFDMDVTSGEPTSVDSPAPKSVVIVPRAPTTLTATASGSGNLSTELDTVLFKFTPASASQEFIQFTETSVAGQLAGTVIPKSGKYADAIVNGFATRYAQGITSSDPFYIVVGDSDNPFTGPGPVPADVALVAFESPCTASSETAESSSTNNDTYQTAQAVSTIPALISGTVGYGSVDPTMDVDYYAIKVTGAPVTIHAATGGDPFTDLDISIYDSTGTLIQASSDDDYQADLSVSAPTDGTYYVSVYPSQSGGFSGSDNTYQLFIGTK